MEHVQVPLFLSQIPRLEHSLASRLPLMLAGVPTVYRCCTVCSQRRQQVFQTTVTALRHRSRGLAGPGLVCKRDLEWPRHLGHTWPDPPSNATATPTIVRRASRAVLIAAAFAPKRWALLPAPGMIVAVILHILIRTGSLGSAVRLKFPTRSQAGRLLADMFSASSHILSSPDRTHSPKSCQHPKWHMLLSGQV